MLPQSQSTFVPMGRETFVLLCCGETTVDYRTVGFEAFYA
jgi:hypothetical protein